MIGEGTEGHVLTSRDKFATRLLSHCSCSWTVFTANYYVASTRHAGVNIPTTYVILLRMGL